MWFLWENPQSQLNEGLAIKQLTFVSQTSRIPHSCKCVILRACITCYNLATPGKFLGFFFYWPAHYPIANAFFWCGWFAGLYLTSIEKTSVLWLVEFLKNHQLQVYILNLRTIGFFSLRKQIKMKEPQVLVILKALKNTWISYERTNKFIASNLIFKILRTNVRYTKLSFWVQHYGT